MTRTVDYSALLWPVPKSELDAFRAWAKSTGRFRAASTTNTIAIVVISVFAALFAVPTLATVVVGALIAGPEFGAVPIVVGLVFVAAAGFGLWLAIAAYRGRWEKWLRLHRFAEANGLEYSPASADPQYSGAIFNRGSSRQSLDHLRSTADRFLDMGNYRFTTGSGKNRTTHTWGFMALHLDRRLPHMVLDSTANNGLFGATNLPVQFDRSQVLSLEGDFDRHFTLYCPKQYERDALYVFTPDLMALLIDEAAPFDVEIVDDWLFVYSSRPFEMTQPAVFQRLFRIVDTIGSKTLQQTERYVDERIGEFSANVVAHPGRRLKSGVPVAALIVFGLFAAVWATQFFGIFGWFAG